MRLILMMFILVQFVFASVGQISAFRGDVIVVRDSQKIVAKVGLTIEEKDTIQTLSNSKAQLIMKDDTTVTIGNDSIFNVAAYVVKGKNDSSVILKATKGAFRVVSGKIGKIAPKRFKLMTKTSTMGIRGTVFIVKTDGINDQFLCTQGSIEVHSQGVSVIVNAGSAIDVKQDMPPQQAKPFTPSELKEVIKSSFSASATQQTQQAQVSQLASTGTQTTTTNENVQNNVAKSVSKKAQKATPASLAPASKPATTKSEPTPTNPTPPAHATISTNPITPISPANPTNPNPTTPTTPANPTNPANPNPTTPTNPANPTNPTNPNPATPTTPTTPANPANPTNPTNPTTPTTPTTPTSPNLNALTPKANVPTSGKATYYATAGSVTGTVQDYGDFGRTHDIKNKSTLSLGIDFGKSSNPVESLEYSIYYNNSNEKHLNINPIALKASEIKKDKDGSSFEGKIITGANSDHNILKGKFYGNEGQRIKGEISKLFHGNKIINAQYDASKSATTPTTPTSPTAPTTPTTPNLNALTPSANIPTSGKATYHAPENSVTGKVKDLGKKYDIISGQSTITLGFDFGRANKPLETLEYNMKYNKNNVPLPLSTARPIRVHLSEIDKGDSNFKANSSWGINSQTDIKGEFYGDNGQRIKGKLDNFSHHTNIKIDAKFDAMKQ